ncbi:MAG: hypothetical protein BGN85_09450 [Alphaproteobacteria bacterium 64-11]|nr:MAG: hypothetical protein BGN85_09450 [Alphaproteobacteria bacterium 64-11]
MRDARAGSDVDGLISARIDELEAAPCLTLADALAFAALSRQIYSGAFRQQADGDPDALNTAIFADAYLSRVIAFLEAATGDLADTFTGGEPVVN